MYCPTLIEQEEDGYKKIPINISIVPTPWGGGGDEVNSTCFGQCCEHCLGESPWLLAPHRTSLTRSQASKLASTSRRQQTSPSD